MKRCLTAIGVLFMLMTGFAGCADQPSSDSGSVDRFINDLRAAGLMIESAGEITQPFFPVKGLVYTVNGSEKIQVYEYADAAAADAEAARISSDGYTVGTTSVLWVSTPHFYKKDNLIVLYVGTNTTVTVALETVLGSRFAGG